MRTCTIFFILSLPVRDSQLRVSSLRAYSRFPPASFFLRAYSRFPATSFLLPYLFEIPNCDQMEEVEQLEQFEQQLETADYALRADMDRARHSVNILTSESALCRAHEKRFRGTRTDLMFHALRLVLIRSNSAKAIARAMEVDEIVEITSPLMRASARALHARNMKVVDAIPPKLSNKPFSLCDL